MATTSAQADAGAAHVRRPGGPGLLVALVGGALVAVALGAYAGIHTPARRETVSLFFTGTLPFKAWTATLVLGLAVFQLLSALRLYGRLPWPRVAPTWLGDAHRLSGTLAFVASLPVAFHCLWSLGLSPPTNVRGFAHALLGCACYGMVVVKVAAVRSRGAAAWVLPVVGGSVFALLSSVWATSALWFFATVGLPGA